MSNTGKFGGFSKALAAIGPGIVVAGSVIGSGELINTPIQAANFGFILLWVVLLSCVVKYFLQVEIARHCLVHNRTTFEALNRVPGPRLAGASWVVVLYVIGYFFAMLTMIGIIGALGGLMHGIYPLASSQSTSTRLWGTILVLLTVALLWRGWYSHLEILVMVLVGGFSVSVAVGVLLVQGTEFRISANDILSGLTFSIGDDRRKAAFAVISLMGALGVAANELLMYPYWILEKGYARELGDSQAPGWADRVRQRVRWIWIDAGFSTALATLVTGAFFLLGAAILFGKPDKPQGPQVVDQISSVFTETWGDWSKAIFLVGAFCTLFSTLVVVAAASGRMAADLLGTFKIIDRNDHPTVHRCHQWVQSFWLVALLAAFVMLPTQPEKFVQSGHYVLGAFLTPLLMFCICWLAFQTDRRVRMGTWTAIALITSVAIIFSCVAMNAVLQWLPKST
jgi:Mn2+/Fe2+ NRAMP family transporter